MGRSANSAEAQVFSLREALATLTSSIECTANLTLRLLLIAAFLWGPACDSEDVRRMPGKGIESLMLRIMLLAALDSNDHFFGCCGEVKSRTHAEGEIENRRCGWRRDPVAGQIGKTEAVSLTRHRCRPVSVQGSLLQGLCFVGLNFKGKARPQHCSRWSD